LPDWHNISPHALPLQRLLTLQQTLPLLKAGARRAL
jgi:hypothetical protein